jgi:hypothetical protein
METKAIKSPLFLAHFEIYHEGHWPEKFRSDFPGLKVQSHIENIRKDGYIESFNIIKPQHHSHIITESMMRTLVNWFNTRIGFRAKTTIFDEELLVLKCYEKDTPKRSIVRTIEEAGGEIPTEIGQYINEGGIEVVSALFASEQVFNDTSKILKILYGNSLEKQPVLHDEPGLCKCNTPLFLETLLSENLPQHRRQVDEYYRGTQRQRNGQKWTSELMRRVKGKRFRDRILNCLLNR